MAVHARVVGPALMAASCACTTASSPFEPRSTELERYFDSATARRGPGVWKWRSYFSVYERHLSRFRGTDVHVMEIGIFSGGSLRMWRWYFGPRTTIYGVDISNRTTVYENDPRYGSPTRIFVGNQSDPDLWAAVNVPRLDVVIEDGKFTTPHSVPNGKPIDKPVEAAETASTDDNGI